MSPTAFNCADLSKLVEAHWKLDAAVFAEYGCSLTLERLLALNYARAAASQGWVARALQEPSPPLVESRAGEWEWGET
jgi:hypothetical protein